MASNIDLTITIASYNTRELLKNCLESIYRTAQNFKIEIFVIDNNSNDGSAKMIATQFPKVYLLKKKQNLFFSRAQNIALKKARGKFILILNSDTLILENVFTKMLKFFKKHPDAGAVTCRESDKLGRLDRICSQFPNPLVEFFQTGILGKIVKPQKLLNSHLYASWQRNTTKKVEAVPGSFIFTKRKILQNVGYFDENMLLFYSDIDLSLRIKRAGYQNYFNADATIIHDRSQSVKLLNPWLVFKIALHDMLYYYKKHFGFLPWLILWFIYRPNWLYFRLKTSFITPANL